MLSAHAFTCVLRIYLSVRLPESACVGSCVFLVLSRDAPANYDTDDDNDNDDGGDKLWTIFCTHAFVTRAFAQCVRLGPTRHELYLLLLR